MVVSQDDRLRVRDNGGLERLARRDRKARKRADRDYVSAYRYALTVEEHGDEVLAVALPDEASDEHCGGMR